ncbi:MAG: hypothetical protein MUF87_08730 [Anaerolineae bacterium]|jgi:Tol biopolymer transport system component|nr:hypothetical protein [Anaerolineae bacterium]
MSSSQNDELLRQATEAAREGKKKEAQRLIAQILENDDENVKAWMLLYRVTDDINDKRIALTSILQIDPSNIKAQEALDRLEAQQGDGKGKTADDEEVAPGLKRREVMMIVGGGLGLIVVVLMVVFVIIQINTQRENEANNNSTQVAAAITNAVIQETALVATSTAAQETAQAIFLLTQTATFTPTNQRGQNLPTEIPPTPTEGPSPMPTALIFPPVSPNSVLLGWGSPDQTDDDQAPIFALNVADGQYRLITPGDKGMYPFARGQNRIVYSQYTPSSFDFTTSVINLSTGEDRLLGLDWEGTPHIFFNTRYPYLSPDGNQIAFIAKADGTATDEIFIFDYNSTLPGRINRITNDQFFYAYPAFSPDGTQLIVLRYNQNELVGGSDLFIITLATNEFRPYTDTGPEVIETMARFSPSGREVAFVADNGMDGSNDIFLRPITGGGADVTLNISNHPADDIHPVFSPDGQWLAFASNRINPRTYQIYVFNLQTGQTYQVTNENDDFFPYSWYEAN